MKKLCMFLGLKIVEILLIVFVPVILGHILPWAKWFKGGYWLNGLLAIVVPSSALLVALFLFYLLILQPILHWLKWNWDIVYKNKNNPFEDLISKLY